MQTNRAAKDQSRIKLEWYKKAEEQSVKNQSLWTSPEHNKDKWLTSGLQGVKTDQHRIRWYDWPSSYEV